MRPPFSIIRIFMISKYLQTLWFFLLRLLFFFSFFFPLSKKHSYVYGSIDGNLRGTTNTSLFFSLLSALWPPAQSPIVKRGVCLQICWYSRWYSFILVIGFFILFCLRRCDSSETGNHDVPHTTNSSSVSYTNLYCSCIIMKYRKKII